MNIKKIVNACPRSSYKNPRFRKDEYGNVLISLGSPSDAVRVIDALRRNCYDCELASQYDATTIKVNLI